MGWGGGTRRHRTRSPHTPSPRTSLPPRTPVQLAVLNPNKCYAMDCLLKKHAQDKVIVFSESIVALKFFAEAYARPFLCGDTAPLEREAAIRYDVTAGDHSAAAHGGAAVWCGVVQCSEGRDGAQGFVHCDCR